MPTGAAIVAALVVVAAMAVSVAAMHVDSVNVTKLMAGHEQHDLFVLPTRASSAAAHRRAAVMKMLRELTTDKEYQSGLTQLIDEFGSHFDPCALFMVVCSAHGTVDEVHLTNVTGKMDLGVLGHDVRLVTVNNSVIEGMLDLDSVSRTVTTLRMSNVTFLGVPNQAVPVTLTFAKHHSMLRKFACRNCNIASIIWEDVPRLTHLDLSANPIANTFDFSKLPSTLSHLNVSGCGIAAKAARVLAAASLPSLRVVDASRNELSGSLCVPWAPGLERVSLGFNKISGSVACLKEHLPSNLVLLELDSNLLQGQLPDLSALWALRVFTASNNKIDSVASWSLFSQECRVIDLSRNALVDLPPLSQLPPSLEVLNVTHNAIEGVTDLSRLPDTMTTLDLSHNRFTGPVNVESLPDAMEFVRLEHNHFTGSLSLMSLPVLLRQIVFHSNDWELKLPPEFS